MSSYTLKTLQELEERCQEKAAKMGLPVPETLFHLVQAEEMYDIIARGLPGRYSHYQFGRRYQEEKAQYDTGRSRVYELVINTRPVYAYLLDGNSTISQLLVMAHVLGHATVYENNQYFEPADKNILSRTRAGAERIDSYIGEYGRERVEDFIDTCESLQYQRSFDQLGAKVTAKPPTWETKAFDELFPEESQKRREEYKAEKEAFRQRFPKQPERDLLAFFEEHSRHLDDWQKDIISIIRMEQDYFAPMMRSNVLHEAQAVYYHQNIVQELMAEDDSFTTDDFMEFQAMNARVLHPHIQVQQNEDGLPEVHCVGVNPYLTGAALYSEIKRICEDPTDEEREQWDWAGNISWDEKRAEIVQIYDDASLLAEFCSPAICEKAKLFERPRAPEEYENLRVLKDEAEEVRQSLVKSKTNFGIPVIEIVDADYKHRGELLLEHRFEDRGLDDEYTRGTLLHVRDLWGHTVTLHTIVTDTEASPSGDVDQIDVWYQIQMGSNNIELLTDEP